MEQYYLDRQYKVAYISVLVVRMGPLGIRLSSGLLEPEKTLWGPPERRLEVPKVNNVTKGPLVRECKCIQIALKVYTHWTMHIVCG